MMMNVDVAVISSFFKKKSTTFCYLRTLKQPQPRAGLCRSHRISVSGGAAGAVAANGAKGEQNGGQQQADGQLRRRHPPVKEQVIEVVATGAGGGDGGELIYLLVDYSLEKYCSFFLFISTCWPK